MSASINHQQQARNDLSSSLL